MALGTTFIIIAGLIIAIWVIIEIKRLKHQVFAIFLIALILFIYISASVVFEGQDINYKSISGLSVASDLYFGWLTSVFGNLKTITTNAIKMDWGADESPPTNVSNE